MLNSVVIDYVYQFRPIDLELEHVKRTNSSSKFPPSSCEELSRLGHYLNGIYAIKDRATKQVQAVYCKFEYSGYFFIINIIYNPKNKKINT